MLEGWVDIIHKGDPTKLSMITADLFAVTLFIPLGFASLADLLSRPKLVALEWLQKSAREATVLGSTMEDGKNIFVWLQMPGGSGPQAYALP
jgi:hypothetical protein